MTRRWVLAIIALNLLVLAGLVFAFPHLMVSPGALMKGHEQLATDCFACHAPWRGTVAERCVTCHALSDIGLRTSKGVPTVSSSCARRLLMAEPTMCACSAARAMLRVSHTVTNSRRVVRSRSRMGCSVSKNWRLMIFQYGNSKVPKITNKTFAEYLKSMHDKYHAIHLSTCATAFAPPRHYS